MNSWLIPILLGSMTSYSGFANVSYGCFCLGDFNRYSKRYERYGVDE